MEKTKIYIFLLLLQLLYSCNWDNINNLELVREGMDKEEVLKIMKKNPKKIKTAFWNDSLFVFYYDTPPGASADIEIIFSKKDSLVVKTYNGG